MDNLQHPAWIRIVVLQRRTKTIKESNRTIGDIVAEDYRSAKVFENHEIDFCCGGKVKLSAACKEKGIDLGEILRKLKEFEDDLHKHVHLENNVLFAKAARL